MVSPNKTYSSSSHTTGLVSALFSPTTTTLLYKKDRALAIPKPCLLHDGQSILFLTVLIHIHLYPALDNVRHLSGAFLSRKERRSLLCYNNKNILIPCPAGNRYIVYNPCNRILVLLRHNLRSPSSVAVRICIYTLNPFFTAFITPGFCLHPSLKYPVIHRINSHAPSLFSE